MTEKSTMALQGTRRFGQMATALFAATLMVGCTVESNDTEPCPEDTYRDGNVCVRDTTPDTGMNNVTPSDAGTEDSGDPTDATVRLELPLSVDEAGYVPSGFFGDGETPGAITMTTDCPMRAGDEAGDCHDITWTPGVGSQGFAGVFWQYPAGNFGSQPGLELPQGATELTFHAWGESGGEEVEFFSGLSADVDGYRATTGVVALTTDPTEYTMSLCDADYDAVVSAFGWVAADATDPVSFHVDDIVMREAEEPCDTTPEEITFPFSVDEVGYVPSGFFGDGETPGAVEMDNDCPMRSGSESVGACHAVTWTTGIGSAGFAGAFWQYPENNFGSQPGLELPAGATGVVFDAWGANGGEEVNFFSGTNEDVDGFNRETGPIALTDSPTEYTIDLRCVDYTDVAGAFGWGAGGVTTGAVSFFIDDIRWVDDGSCDATNQLNLPFWIDDEGAGFAPSGFMGDAAGITMTNDCPMRAPDASGMCHAVEWSPSASSPGWAGVWWQYPENNWGTLPGQPVEPGATEVSFYAWGADGGEVVEFSTGYMAEDGFSAGTGNVTLTTQPTEYTIDVSGVSYDQVRGAFSWVSNMAGGATFYIDDIHWQ